MAWCSLCTQDRPIQRQTFSSKCPFCGQTHTASHHPACRGPVEGALDVCTFCNTPTFAKAVTLKKFIQLEIEEKRISGSAWSVLARHGVKNVHPRDADNILQYIRTQQKQKAIEALKNCSPSFSFTEATKIVDAIRKDLGLASSGVGCAAALLALPFLLLIVHLKIQP